MEDIIVIIQQWVPINMPGQGLLTMLIGISFMDFPNKRKLEARIVGQPVFLKAINAMRQKFDKLPLTLSPSSD